jgi:23S rRNA (uracil1939-C5)-methyltransferase
VNFQQNRAIVSILIDFCTHVSIGSILDLCCGNGNFSIPLARKAGKVTGFETFHKSVQLAKRNAEYNGIDNAVYVCKDSATGLLELVDTGEKVDLVILDPPRTGAADVTRNLYRLNASYVIYISCDPLTLARDLGILIKSGFQLIRLQPVDMFPQTYHLESIAFLQAPAR